MNYRPRTLSPVSLAGFAVLALIAAAAAAGCRREAPPSTPPAPVAAGSAAAPLPTAIDPEERASLEAVHAYFSSLTRADVAGLSASVGGDLQRQLESTIAAKGAAGVASEIREQAEATGIRGFKVSSARRTGPDEFRVEVQLDQRSPGGPRAVKVQRVGERWLPVTMVQ